MKRIIVTVGPAILNAGKMGIADCGSHIYRINGAHGTLAEVEQYILDIKKEFDNPDILIDLPGNKVRTAGLTQPIRLEKGTPFDLFPHQVNYPELHTLFKKGDVVLADDSTLCFVVEHTGPTQITFVPKLDGFLRNNKGLHVKGISKNLPFLFSRDHDLIELGKKHAVRFLGLSFVRTAEDIETARKLTGATLELIAKIETLQSVQNLNEILRTVDSILIDRGDLSTEVGLEKVPAYQRFIVEKALFYNKQVYLATQILKNMVDKPIPTIAEMIDLYNSFKMGIHGIQLSEETAVGLYPAECLKVIKNVVREIDSEIKN